MTVAHKKLKEEPVPLCIDNPVYDENAIELQEKATQNGANNNINKSYVVDNNSLIGSGDLGPSVVKSSPDSKSAPNGEPAQTNDVSHRVDFKGTEKLISPTETTFTRRVSKKIVLIVVGVILLSVVAAVSAYFLYKHLAVKKQPLSPEHKPPLGYLPATAGIHPLDVRITPITADANDTITVQVYYSEVWSELCYSSLNVSEALVACRQYYNTVAIHHAELKAQQHNSSKTLWSYPLLCDPGYASLKKCNLTSEIRKCHVKESLVIRCLFQPREPNSVSQSTNVSNRHNTNTTVLDKHETSTIVTRTLNSNSSASHMHNGSSTAHNTLSRNYSIPHTTMPSHQSATTVVLSSTTAHVDVKSVLNVSASVAYGQADGEGLLLITANGSQYSVCHDHWTNNAALVACRSSGFQRLINKNDVFIIPRVSVSSIRGLRIFPYEILCNGTESSLSQCLFQVSATGCFLTASVLIKCARDITTVTSIRPTVSTSVLTTSTQSYATTTPTVSSTVTHSTTPEMHTDTDLDLDRTDKKPIKYKADVRLVSGLQNSQGRLEVRINDTWGTVCDDGWSRESAFVVCKQLGFPKEKEHMRYTERDGVHRGHPGQVVWLRNVICEGSEEYLTACEHELNNGHCEHVEDVMLSCEPNVTLINRNGDIRLNPGPSMGRLEYYYNGAWGSFCDEGWDNIDAIVACRQLGYGNVTATEISPDGYDLTNELEWFISELNCNGTEDRIDACVQSPVKDNQCADPGWFWTGNRRIFIACDPTSKAAPLDHIEKIRLVNGLEDENVGVLQYREEGQWGTLCREGWSMANAQLACRLLGFPGVREQLLNLSALRSIPDASLSVPFHGTFYTCPNATASVNEIGKCPHFKVAPNCVHRRDEVAISCQPKLHQLVDQNFTSDQTVRLVDGQSRYEGRVEVLINGTWGRVCDNDDWTHNNMKYVCYSLFRMLHFSTELLPINTAGLVSPFVAGQFNCSSLVPFNQCSFNTDREYLRDCTHDAQVKCI